ncbi:MAG: methyltransferase domain-containing protein [Nevskia sp.]|nr:methyltransferase domain-containing protein [Nevskia sp.]
MESPATASPVTDFGRTAADYARHRAGFPPALFERLRPFGIGEPGQRILDLGTGTGTLARGFARAGGAVTGLDVAPQLLEQARVLDRSAGLSVEYRVARAETTGLPDRHFDVVSAGQCWHWFDRPAAAAEVRRLLRPGGRVVIAHFDWLPLPGNVVAATEALILKHNSAWGMAGGSGTYPRWFTDLALAGFTGLESFSFDQAVTYTHEAWRGRIRASAGVAASLPPERVITFDQEHRAMLDSRFPEDPLQVPHRVFALIGTRI